MLESKFQADLIAELKELFPGCYVLKNDANYIQGFPDLLILWNEHWAALEVKQNPNAHLQPNQMWYIQKLGEMSFAAIINPDNKDCVLSDLLIYFHDKGV